MEGAVSQLAKSETQLTDKHPRIQRPPLETAHHIGSYDWKLDVILETSLSGNNHEPDPARSELRDPIPRLGVGATVIVPTQEPEYEQACHAHVDLDG